nr:hypothetical protein [Tanacetum cinerariifolium]
MLPVNIMLRPIFGVLHIHLLDCNHTILNGSLFLGLEDVLSWLLVVEKRDVIAMVRNAIALFKLVIGSSPGGNDGTARPEKFLEAYIVDNEKVLQKIMRVVEKGNIVEKLVMTVVDSE